MGVLNSKNALFFFCICFPSQIAFPSQKKLLSYIMNNKSPEEATTDLLPVN